MRERGRYCPRDGLNDELKSALLGPCANTQTKRETDSRDEKERQSTGSHLK